VVVVLGAYTRLTDAGLGCPDWPGCYGFSQVPSSAQERALAASRFPDAPLHSGKAWNEMIHRYAAGGLGLMVLLLAWLNRNAAPGIRRLSWGLLALVVFQAMLGMWTVTLKLMPQLVMAHLLGGLLLFSGLWVLASRYFLPSHAARSPALLISLLVWCVLLLQIALGGWTSANYAALVCTQLPFCEADWQALWSAGEAFQPPLALKNYEFGHLDYAARVTVHVSHRLGALVTATLLLGYAIYLWRCGRQRLSYWLGGLLLLQLGLGISNVLASLPLPVAVAHNATAALLLASLSYCVALAYRRAPEEMLFTTRLEEQR